MASYPVDTASKCASSFVIMLFAKFNVSKSLSIISTRIFLYIDKLYFFIVCTIIAFKIYCEIKFTTFVVFAGSSNMSAH